MKLLHLDSSALTDHSVTRQLSAAIVAQWREAQPGLQVEYLDLDRNPPPHFTGRSLAKTDTVETTQADRIMEQFLAADIVVIGAPMYNLTIPSTLKAWIDRIAVAGKTFRYTENGSEGLARGKRVVIASGRGGVYSGKASDFQEPYLRHVFAFLGIEEVAFVRAEGVAYSPQHRRDAIAGALASISTPLQAAA